MKYKKYRCTFFEETAHCVFCKSNLLVFFIGLLLLDTTVEEWQEIICGWGEQESWNDYTPGHELKLPEAILRNANLQPTFVLAMTTCHFQYEPNVTLKLMPVLSPNMSMLTSVKIQPLSVSRSLTHTELH